MYICIGDNYQMNQDKSVSEYFYDSLKHLNNANGRIIGQSIPRKDAMAKSTGTARFAADLQMPEMLYLKILRSPYAHARIMAINVSSARSVSGVIAVLTSADVSGTNRLKISRADQPVLCDSKVRYIGDPVAAVVAVSERIAEEALAGIE